MKFCTFFFTFILFLSSLAFVKSDNGNGIIHTTTKTTHGNGNNPWEQWKTQIEKRNHGRLHGADANEVIWELHKLAEEREKTAAANENSNSWFTRVLAFFTGNFEHNLEGNRREQRHRDARRRELVHDCLITPMNCQMAIPELGSARNDRQPIRVFLVRDEDLERILQKFGNK